MSWQATAWVIEKSAHKGSALLTMLCIANCANEAGTDAFPGLPRLAKDTRMSVRQVSRIIEKLESSGELDVRRIDGRNHHYSFPQMTPDKMSRVRKEKTPDISATPRTFSAPTQDIAMSSDPSVRSISKNGQGAQAIARPRIPGSPEARDEKAPRYLITEMETPEPLVLECIRAAVTTKFPTIPFEKYYRKWWRSRDGKGGIGRRRGEKATIRQYTINIEGYFETVSEGGIQNGNGYGSNGHGKAKPGENIHMQPKMSQAEMDERMNFGK